MTGDRREQLKPASQQAQQTAEHQRRPQRNRPHPPEGLEFEVTGYAPYPKPLEQGQQAIDKNQGQENNHHPTDHRDALINCDNGQKR